ncbi:Cytochrome P450 [Canna indica]|uniref:Cytochrome P450 n=1 Tax=Canna indica TaxID=4628 RepID=A0AAQ3KE90_9LILI|nr:Cytochrome P450 [Canna indica]
MYSKATIAFSPETAMDFFSLAAAGVLALLAIFTFAVLIRISSRRRYKFPPVAGTVFHQLYYFRRIYDYQTEISQKHKTFRLLSPDSCQHIYTTDPAILEYVLKTNFLNYGKGWYNYEILKDMFGDGIFAVDGDKWRHQRKLASFGFSTKALRDFSGVIFKSNAAKLAHVFSSYATSNEKFDIQDLFMKSTMDSIFRIGFGVELNCLDGSGRHGIEFAEAFDAGNELIVIRYLNPFWKIVRYLNIGSEATLKMKIKLVDKYLYELISIRIQQLSSIGNKSSNKEDILSKFIEESIKDPERMTLQYLRDIVLNFVIAGKDTTAGTLSWFFYLICKNPHVQEKIYKEVKEAIEADEDVTFDAFSSSINDESLHKMHYLHAALSETLRIFPPAAMVIKDSKVCFSDDILPGGYNVRKGDIVYYQPYAMGRMEYLWGKDAESFCPERWLDDNGIFQPENPYKFPAFQAGPRICLGKEFAYRQMKIFAAVLVRFFKFKLSDEKKVVQYKVTTTLLINEEEGSNGGGGLGDGEEDSETDPESDLEYVPGDQSEDDDLELTQIRNELKVAKENKKEKLKNVKLHKDLETVIKEATLDKEKRRKRKSKEAVVNISYARE